MNVVFIDPKCPTPYDSDALERRGLGGTEATVVRVGRALAVTHRVRVFQHNRTTPRDEGSRLSFLPLAGIGAAVEEADHVVFLQRAQDFRSLSHRSRAHFWIWLHNFLGDEVPFYWQDHARHRLGIVCVSQTHAVHTMRYLRRHPVYRLTAGWLGRSGVSYIYNPLDDALAPDPRVARDPHKLVFFSSRHKGIEHVLDAFKQVHAADDAFRLYVADPGYIRSVDTAHYDHPGIVKIGSLPHREVMRHVRESLCVFYPQHKRPETFGLVYAEANAQGIPVLAHDFGAAREVLADRNPPIDARDTAHVVRTLLNWSQRGGPKVAARPEFLLDSIAAQWTALLAEPNDFVERQRLLIA